MSEHIKQTIAELQAELAKQEQATLEKKRLINMLCAHAGMQPMYSDTEMKVSKGTSLSIRSDQFYGQSMVTAIRQILEMRKALDQGPASINELYAAMQEGGFAFDARDDDNAKRGVRISVTKNSSIFHKIPSGKIGLLEWYPGAKQPKAKRLPLGEALAGGEDPTEEEPDEGESE
jgi:hypothetical protein